MPKRSTSKGTVEIKLSRGYFALLDAGSPLASFKWYALESKPGVFYAARWAMGDRTLLLHREVVGALSGQQVDHKNGDRLDCRRSNLRLATPQENNRNSRARSGVFKGITLVKNRWRAQITVAKGRHRHLGYFSTPEEAALVYNEAAKIYFGEFARLNVIL